MNCQNINRDTILIGHSAGAGFILKYLALHQNLKVRQVILVAPWIDTGMVNSFGFFKSFKMSDDILKQELMLKAQKELNFEKDDVLCIFEDRSKVVKMLEDNILVNGNKVKSKR